MAAERRPTSGAQRTCGLRWLCLAGCLAFGQPAAADVEHAGRRVEAGAPLLLAVDADDGDEDGLADDQQLERVPAGDLLQLSVDGPGDATLQTLGGVRLVREGRPLPSPAAIPERALPLTFALQATRSTSSSRPAALLITQAGRSLRVPLHAVELSLLDGANQPLDASKDALGVAQRITNDGSLPRASDYDARSPEPNDVRVQVVDALAPGKRVRARLQVLSPDGTRVRASLALSLVRPRPDMPFRSRFVRLVGDDVDAGARGVAGQVLRVSLRDRVRVVYETAAGSVQQQLRVGRPGDESGPRAARQATLRVTVLRAREGSDPVIGNDELSALRIVRDELAIANEIWLQCLLTTGAPSETSVQLADPPGATLLAVADGDGLPARGGTIRLRVDGRVLSPIEIGSGSSPQHTALRIEQRLRSAGYQTTVTLNPSTVFGAGPSADVLVRRGDGQWVVIDGVPGAPLTTDPQQRVSIGRVDLSDGLEEFDNMTAQSGTLEERTLIKALSDEDPGTIELFIINRFTHGTRQGEAFIAASSGSITNTLVLDRNGLRQRQTAWTMAHELGHVLLNQPLHPDNVGSDTPMLLMDSDNNRGTVNGPKRLLPQECARVRYEGGMRAFPPLLQPHDPRLRAPQ